MTFLNPLRQDVPKLFLFMKKNKSSKSTVSRDPMVNAASKNDDDDLPLATTISLSVKLFHTSVCPKISTFVY